MKRNLRDMKLGGGLDDDTLKRAAEQLNAGDAAGVEAQVRQYQGKSEGELLAELKRVTGEQRANGGLDENKMRQMTGMLTPMLTPEQRKRMEEIMRSL